MTEDFDVRLVKIPSVIRPCRNTRQILGWAIMVRYKAFLSDPDGFWDRIARDLDWIRPWDAVKEWDTRMRNGSSTPNSTLRRTALTDT